MMKPALAHMQKIWLSNAGLANTPCMHCSARKEDTLTAAAAAKPPWLRLSTYIKQAEGQRATATRDYKTIPCCHTYVYTQIGCTMCHATGKQVPLSNKCEKNRAVLADRHMLNLM
jgi:hypothetical protein